MFTIHKHIANHLRENQTEETDNNAWMITFADLLALVLTFFVLLYSMSTVTDTKWETVSRSLSQRLKPDKTEHYTLPSEELSVTKEESISAESLRYIYSVLSEKILTQGGLTSMIRVNLLEDRMVISLVKANVFVSGKTALNAKANELLFFIGQILNNIDNRVEVISYADPRPINTEKFPSNWELSLSRAITVSNGLRKGGYPYTINAFGRASSQFSELDAGLSIKERYDLSRRIDIVIRTEQHKGLGK